MFRCITGEGSTARGTVGVAVAAQKMFPVSMTDFYVGSVGLTVLSDEVGFDAPGVVELFLNGLADLRFMAYFEIVAIESDAVMPSCDTARRWIQLICWSIFLRTGEKNITVHRSGPLHIGLRL